MRKDMMMFHDTKRDCVHFTGGKLGMEIGFDLWITLDSGRTLFQNVEEFLTGCGEAHNLTSMDYVMTNGDCDEYLLIYNVTEEE